MSEIKAKALFNFLAEGPSELNLTAGEIVIITSGADGNDWWYAQNSGGQSGAVPATYVEILPTESESIDIKETTNPSIEQDLTVESLTANQNFSDPTTSNSFDLDNTIVDSQYSLLGDLTSVVQSNDVYDTSSSSIIPISNNDNALEQSANDDSNKNKSEKSRLFTMTRQKTKSDSDKRRGSTDNGLDSSARSKDDSDSDGFSDSGSSSHRTLSTSNKHSTSGGVDSKTTSRTKLFDKHGVGNYLLHEWKTKPDEHVEIALDENDGNVCWLANPSIPPFTCKIENSSKETKFSGLKSFVEYKIHPQIDGSRVVGRRYKQFDWLHEQLAIKYRFICVPPLPVKQLAGRFEQEFIEERRRQLELWLNRICQHPVLCASYPVQHFLTCELTEKNNRDWKAGKRKIEKDELRESSWLHCVTFTDPKLSDVEIGSQIDAFAQQQPGLEIHLKNLSQGFSKYLERHTEIYEHDIQRVGELFTKLHVVVQVDASTPGNDDLSNSMSKISNSYNEIAELYKTKGYESIRDFMERTQDYIGLLGCFPIIISIQRYATEFIRNAQQKGPIAVPDLAGAIHRYQVLNHVVLAEMNFFQKQKVNDLTVYMKSLLDEQVHFYDKISSELRDALSTFN